MLLKYAWCILNVFFANLTTSDGIILYKSTFKASSLAYGIFVSIFGSLSDDFLISSIVVSLRR